MFAPVAQLWAQTTTNVSAIFAVDTVVAGYGQTFSNKLKLENKTAGTITLINGSISESSLLQLPDSILLKADEVRYVPVKYLSSEAIFTKASKTITVKYTNRADGKTIGAGFVVRLSQPDKIIISTPESVVYLNTITRTVQFKVRCINKGYTVVNMQLKPTVNPVGLQLLDPIKVLTLQPGTEETVTFDARLVDSKPDYSPDFNVLIECTDINRVNLAHAIVHITSLESSKRQMPSAQNINQQTNLTELSFTNLSKNYSYYTARANGTVNIDSSSNLNYNINLNYYNNSHGVEGFDTWVAYTNKHFGIKLGNLMENLDYPLYGKGVKASVFFNKHNSIDMYYVQNSYFLFSQINRDLPGATTYAGSYNFSSRINASKVNLLYSHNPLTNTYTRFVNGYSHFRLSANQSVDVKGGYSSEEWNSKTQTGFAAGFAYTYRSKLFDVNLNNYYSSAYYSGLQRGTLQLDDQLNYHPGKHISLFAHYERIHNAPHYLLDTLSIFNFYNNTLKYEAGLSVNLKSLNVTLHPYMLEQDINQAYNNNFFHISSPLSSTANRVGLDLNYAIKPGQQLMLIGDFGQVKTNNYLLAKQNYNSLKVNLSYFNKWWGLNGMYQDGAYYLSEEITAATVNKDFRAYAFGPSVHVSAFNNKLDVAVNDYLNFASYSAVNNNSLNATASYHFKKGWQVSGQVYYNTYAGHASAYNMQSRVAISKQFTQTRASGLKSLQMSFFDDENNDGQLNNNEKPVEGLIIGLTTSDANSSNNLTTITDKKGMVDYSNLKPGEYDLTVVRGNGLHLASPVSVSLVKNEKMMIPMVKSGWLKGNIVPVEQQYVKTKPLLEGLRIVAVDSKNQTFTTLTNEAGEFEFSLPVSDYRITVLVDGQKYSINNPNQLVAVNLKDNKVLQFGLVDESRKTVVKQF